MGYTWLCYNKSQILCTKSAVFVVCGGFVFFCLPPEYFSALLPGKSKLLRKPCKLVDFLAIGYSISYKFAVYD